MLEEEKDWMSLTNAAFGTAIWKIHCFAMLMREGLGVVKRLGLDLRRVCLLCAKR